MGWERVALGAVMKCGVDAAVDKWKTGACVKDRAASSYTYLRARVRLRIDNAIAKVFSFYDWYVDPCLCVWLRFRHEY
jgi:hypothetical protein